MTATCKLGEKGCWNDGKCRATSNCENKVITNADRIRAMNNEELAELVGKYVYCGLCPLQHRCIAGECNKVVMGWLKQPAED